MTPPAADPGHADVLIIGAGPSGGVAARRLAAEGVKVVCLEQGHWQDRDQYRGAQWDWELAAAKGWASHPNIRARPTDYPIDFSDSDMQAINFNGVGGGTILFNAIWIRFLESTFRTKSRFGLGDDWPVSYQELQPFYERTDREFGVSGMGGNPAYPPGEDPPLPPLPFNKESVAVARAIAAHGWHWWPDTNAIISTPYDERRPCVQRGTCPTGCNEGAKSSADITHWGKAVTLGAILVTGARVRRITLDAAGLANGAEWVDEAGAEHFQSADVVLVAANGVGTPRLLLNSASARFPDGLANRSGLVGRNLMMHPLALVQGFFHDEIDFLHNGSTVQCLQFAEDDPSRGHRLGAKWSLHPGPLGPLAAAQMAWAQHGPGGDYHKRFGELFRHGMHWSIMCEDLPEESNRVVLSKDITDSSGIPAPKVHYRYSENSLRCLDYNVQRAMQVFEEAGAWKVQSANPAGANAHFTGTARMGDDPARSVVDRWGMAHDVPNLGILDGSVFVTCSAVNPTSTLSALSLRNTEHLIERRASLPTPQRRTNAPVSRPRATPIVEPPAPEPVTAEERARLKMLAGVLIPAADGMPSGAEVGVEGRLLDRVLGSRPDFIPNLKAALSQPADDPAARLARLAADAPLAHQALLTVVASAYYLDPGVRGRLAYDGQTGRAQKPDSYPAYIAEGLLDHLLTPA